MNLNNYESPLRLAGDKTVGRLVKWLRVLGLEVEMIEACKIEELPSNTILLTRKRNLSDPKKVVLIPYDQIHKQLRFFFQKFPELRFRLKPFSICIRCNAKLKTVAREEVFGLVPDYIYQTHTTFRICPVCKRVYWPGSHRQRMIKRLKEWGLFLETDHQA